MKRFKIWYKANVTVLNDFLDSSTEKMFNVTLTEYVWDWFRFRFEKNLLAVSKHHDYFECIKEIDEYIEGNRIDKSKVKFNFIMEEK